MKGIREEGSQTCLYITGMPGLGKTACLLKCIRGLQEMKNLEFDSYYINGLKLRTP